MRSFVFQTTPTIVCEQGAAATLSTTVGALGGTRPLALVANGLLVLTATFAFAQLSYTTIERPFLSMRARYVRAAGDTD